MYIWICIPVFNRIDYTLKCLQTLHKQAYKNFKVVICDHGSTDGTTERIQQDFPDSIVLSADQNLWWTGAINRCVSYVLQHSNNNDYLLTLNNDTELPEDYLMRLVENASKYPSAIISSVIHDIKTGKQVEAGYCQSWWQAKEIVLSFENDHLPDDCNVIKVTHVSGRGALFPTTVFRQLGLYDEQHLPHYGADYDFSHKARRADYAIYVCKNCRVLSHVEATGMTVVRNRISLQSFINYFTSNRSPANLKARWWYGWNNCPKALFPSYMVLDVLRIFGSYFKHFLFVKS